MTAASPLTSTLIYPDVHRPEPLSAAANENVDVLSAWTMVVPIRLPPAARISTRPQRSADVQTGMFEPPPLPVSTRRPAVNALGPVGEPLQAALRRRHSTAPAAPILAEIDRNG